jgi:pimeloyl-ACP methyl ester carboxylesterase
MAIKQVKLENKIFDISYKIINPTLQDNIVFLHGWGANKEIMQQAFDKYFTNLKHIYLDLAGFGKSTNDYILTTYDYAKITNKFLHEIEINPQNSIIVGHSFGGKVAALLNPSKLILLSSAGIIKPKSKKILLKIKIAKIFNKIGLKKVTKFLRSDDVNMMNENMYKTFKNVVDEDFSSYFSNYKGKAKIFWGKYDTATTLDAGKQIHSLIKNSTFNVFDGDHYFFLKYSDNIAKLI